MASTQVSVPDANPTRARGPGGRPPAVFRPDRAEGANPLSSQADVRSIEALKDFRAALVLYAEEALGALASVGMEAKRTVHWVAHDRRDYWINEVKRGRERVSAARAEVSKRRMAQTAGSGSAFGEQKEILRAAEARLREAEAKVVLVRKWEPILAQAVLEMKASTRRVGDLAGGDVPRAIASLTRMVDALEAYLRESPPDGLPPALPAIAAAVLADDPDPEPLTTPDSPVPEPDDPEATTDG